MGSIHNIGEVLPFPKTHTLMPKKTCLIYFVPGSNCNDVYNIHWGN